MIVLRKPGKADYNGAECALTGCPSQHHSKSPVILCSRRPNCDVIKTHDLLQRNHFSSRPGLTTMDSLHCVTKFVKDAW